MWWPRIIVAGQVWVGVTVVLGMLWMSTCTATVSLSTFASTRTPAAAAVGISAFATGTTYSTTVRTAIVPTAAATSCAAIAAITAALAVASA